MIIADSSFIVEGLIKRKDLFEESEDILTLDFAMYEVSNSIWKHEFLLKDLKNGRAYLSEFIQLIESESIRVIRLSPRLLQRSARTCIKTQENHIRHRVCFDLSRNGGGIEVI